MGDKKRSPLVATIRENTWGGWSDWTGLLILINSFVAVCTHRRRHCDEVGDHREGPEYDDGDMYRVCQ